MNLADVRKALTRLEKKDDLEAMLAPADEGLPWHDFVWMLQFPAYIGIAIHVAVMGANARPEDDLPPDAEILWLLFLVMIALALKFLHPLFRNRIQKLRRRVRRKGLVVPAAIVQASPNWGQTDWAWGTVVISRDPSVLQDTERLVDAARGLFDLKWADRRELPEAHAKIAWGLYHEITPLRSQPVPDELANGLRDCIVATVQLPAEPLRSGALMLALALPDERDPHAVAMLPDDVLA
ncbi:MAG: hypothetical protein KAI24_02815 [Planctomycetes bacterium]|nr:hypothetical protein [Planctomycetota bacterium]